METPKKALDRRDYPRLDASFGVRFAVCGQARRSVPGFTSNVSVGGFCFHSPDTSVKPGDQISVEILVPGFDDPLYFLGEVIRVTEDVAGHIVACRFDWLGESERNKEKLEALLAAHGA